jgi:hypothetical protein
MKKYRSIPRSDKKLRYFPAVLTPTRNLKKGESVFVYFPTLFADADDQDPIVSEDD